jgi:endonuclease-3
MMTDRDASQQPLSPDAPAAERWPEVVRRLRAQYPDAHVALDYKNPFQLLIATILSAQTTDVRVNEVTPALFAAYPDAATLAAAQRKDVEEIVRPTGFFRQKARFIQETAQRLDEEYGGEVPGTMDDLLTLTGVARKTANVVLGEIFRVADGVVVDTHVKRLSQRLGFSEQKDAGKVEEDLMALLPRELWIEISHLLIFHGRQICSARNPDCANCPLVDLCPAAVV